VVDFIFSSPEAANQASSSLKTDGHEVLSIAPQGHLVHVQIRKSAA
jgi:hypothetical protein